MRVCSASFGLGLEEGHVPNFLASTTGLYQKPSSLSTAHEMGRIPETDLQDPYVYVAFWAPNVYTRLASTTANSGFQYSHGVRYDIEV